MTNEIPEVIGIRTGEFTPLLQKWQAENKGVKWSELLRRGLKKELAPLAGKRYAALVDASETPAT